MAFTPEQSKEIKEQLIEQVDKLPQENKEQIKEYIKKLDEEQLEEFLKKNKINVGEEGFLEQESGKNPEKPQECIFCQIAKNKIPSYKIAENKKSVAILEINPLSKAHSIVLPLEHKPIEKIPKSSLSLAQKIAKKIKKKFKPEDIKIETSNFQGHALINIIPLYKDIPLKKSKADEEDLRKIQKKIETKKRQTKKKEMPKSKEKTEKEIKIQQEKDLNLPKIHFRIP